MDIQAHYQALYDAARAAMDASFADVPLLHIDSNDSQTGEPISWPFVVYRQDVERPTGTTGGGASKILRSAWVFVAYTADFAEGLNIATAIVNGLVDANITTSDGYVTTNLELQGFQPLFEDDSQVYAVHFRFEWERSA